MGAPASVLAPSSTLQNDPPALLSLATVANSRQNGDGTQHAKEGICRRTKNDRRRHLTGNVVERLLEATRGSRNEACERRLLLLMFRHGLRVSEACRLMMPFWRTLQTCNQIGRRSH